MVCALVRSSPRAIGGDGTFKNPLIFMRFHGVFLGSQHEIRSKRHNGKVRYVPRLAILLAVLGGNGTKQTGIYRKWPDSLSEAPWQGVCQGVQRGAGRPPPGAGASGNRWHRVGGRGQWKRPFVFPICCAGLQDIFNAFAPGGLEHKSVLCGCVPEALALKCLLHILSLKVAQIANPIWKVKKGYYEANASVGHHGNVHIAHAIQRESRTARSRSPAGTRATLRVSFLTILLRS